MRVRKLTWLLVFLGMLFVGAGFLPASAQAGSTPTPDPFQLTLIPTLAADRTLPAVGTNAGLVCGASVLVMIILGGLVWSRWRRLKGY